MGVVISDRVEGFEQNYRWPDVAVFLAGTTSRECGTHWCGGPDFMVEIRCRGDRTMQKLPFYASINVRELLIIDRDPWSMEIYRLRDSELRRVDRIEVDDARSIRQRRRLAGLPFHSSLAAANDSGRASGDGAALVRLNKSRTMIHTPAVRVPRHAIRAAR